MEMIKVISLLMIEQQARYYKGRVVYLQQSSIKESCAIFRMPSVYNAEKDV